jgi:hypothetical protein
LTLAVLPLFLSTGCKRFMKYEPMVLSEVQIEQEPCDLRVQVASESDGLITYSSPGAGYRLALRVGGPFTSPGALGGGPCRGHGAEHQYVGEVKGDTITLRGDPAYPLTFKAVKGKGYVYLCGRGVVKTAKKEYRFGEGDSTSDWIPRLKDSRQEVREGAAEALGWLARSRSDVDKAGPALIAALKDPAPEVRRDAAEALGRIADPKALPVLRPLTQAATTDEDFADVATDAVWRILEHAPAETLHGSADPTPRLPDYLPSYPQVNASRSLTLGNGAMGVCRIETSASAMDILNFYKDRLEREGISFGSSSMMGDSGSLHYSRRERGITVEVSASSSQGRTVGNLRFIERQAR